MTGEKSDLEKLTDAVTTLNTDVKVECASIRTAQDGFSKQLDEVKTDLGHVSRRQLQCPARAGWDDMKENLDKLEDDTKQIVIDRAYKNGKGSKTPRSIPPEAVPKKEPSALWRSVREKLGIAFMMACTAGLVFLATWCTDRTETLETKLLQQQAQIEKVRRETKVVGSAADALVDVLSDTEGVGE